MNRRKDKQINEPLKNCTKDTVCEIANNIFANNVLPVKRAHTNNRDTFPWLPISATLPEVGNLFCF